MAKTKRPLKDDVAMRPAPSLAFTCSQLEDLYAGVLTGTVPVDRGRALLGIKKQQMKSFDYAIQIGRMMPSIRPDVAKLFGFPDQAKLSAEQAKISAT